MSQLIQELENEHLVIKQTLSDVRKFGIDSKEGQIKLILAKESLLAHLKKEDEKLYPVLDRVAESDSGLNLTLASFAQEMAEISQVAISFFDKYAMGGQGDDFEQEFSKLYSTLSQRIKKEDVIYKRYDIIMRS